MANTVAKHRVQTLVLESAIRYKDYKQTVYTENQVVREECITALWRNTGNVAVWISDCIRLAAGESMVVEGSLHCQYIDGILHVVPIRKIIDTTIRWDYTDLQDIEEVDKKVVLLLTDIQYPQ